VDCQLCCQGGTARTIYFSSLLTVVTLVLLQESLYVRSLIFASRLLLSYSTVLVLISFAGDVIHICVILLAICLQATFSVKE